MKDDPDHIRRYWDRQAQIHGASSEASWGDTHMMALEGETISRFLADGDRVLDVGCGNGHATFQQAERHRLKKIVGVDFSSAMVAVADKLAKDRGCGENIEFGEADIRALPFDDHSFDVVYTTRVLINLPTWGEQQQGIRECVRVSRPGGKVVLSEAFWEPLALLNALRILCRLPPLVEPEFNRYLKKSLIEEFLRSDNLPFAAEDYSSVYYLGSRLLRELVTDAAAYPGYTNPVNQRFYELEREFSGGGFGIQQAYVIQKPSPGNSIRPHGG